LTLVSLHAGVTLDRVRAATGWDVAVAAQLAVTPPPQAEELAALRELHRRTARAHGAETAA
jgi:glutaconate CoA-transferase subunit B